MRFVLAALAVMAAATGAVACTDALAKTTQYYCIGSVFILLGLMVTLYISAPQFGEKSALKKISGKTSGDETVA
jgi:hypothetical protein